MVRVRTPLPTEVPNAFEMSLAPMPNPSINARIKAIITAQNRYA